MLIHGNEVVFRLHIRCEKKNTAPRAGAKVLSSREPCVTQTLQNNSKKGLFESSKPCSQLFSLLCSQAYLAAAVENLSNLNARAPAHGPTRVAWRLFNRSLYRYFLQVRKAQFKPSAAGTTIYHNCTISIDCHVLGCVALIIARKG